MFAMPVTGIVVTEGWGLGIWGGGGMILPVHFLPGRPDTRVTTENPKDATQDKNS